MNTHTANNYITRSLCFIFLLRWPNFTLMGIRYQTSDFYRKKYLSRLQKKGGMRGSLIPSISSGFEDFTPARLPCTASFLDVQCAFMGDQDPIKSACVICNFRPYCSARQYLKQRLSCIKNLQKVVFYCIDNRNAEDHSNPMARHPHQRPGVSGHKVDIMTHDIDTLIRLSQKKAHISAVRRLQLAFELELRDAKINSRDVADALATLNAAISKEEDLTGSAYDDLHFNLTDGATADAAELAAYRAQKPVASCIVADGIMVPDSFGDYCEPLADGSHDLFVRPVSA
ncbi:hypothetical protein HB435_002659 [Salmonella enterica subsp. enterica serovar Stanley]|nr:hypothetical protein [Salmonella enterica subsp. enterica serovar Stanley]